MLSCFTCLKIKMVPAAKKINVAIGAFLFATASFALAANKIPPKTEDATANCEIAAKEAPREGLTSYRAGRAWSGTRVAFGALAKDQVIYFGYYDPEKFLTISSLDTRTSRLCSVKLPSQFNGWDAHNRIVMAFDKDGHLHVAGNAHGTPLVYATTTKKNSIEGLTLTSMTGAEENRVTYPQFYKGENGTLLFAYRTGGSGNGSWIINQLNQGHWSRYIKGDLYGNSWDDKRISAYPSFPAQDTKGLYHIAIVWRRTGDASTNVEVSYVSTKDFRTFYSADGKKAPSPILPIPEISVLKVDSGSGLLNNAKVVADENSLPYVFYTKYDEAGKNGIFVAKWEKGQWRHKLIASSGTSTEKIMGTGSLGVQLRFSDISVSKNRISVTISFKGQRPQQYVLSSTTLEQVESPKAPTKAFDAGLRWSAPKDLYAAREVKRPILNWDNTGNSEALGQLRYFTQPTDRDRPQACVRSKPTACAPPPTDLILLLK